LTLLSDASATLHELYKINGKMEIGEDSECSFFGEQASPKSSFFFSPMLLIFSFALIERTGGCVRQASVMGEREKEKRKEKT